MTQLIAPKPSDHEVSPKDINDILAILQGKRAAPVTLTGTLTVSGAVSLTGPSVAITNLVRQAARVTHGSNQEVPNSTDTYVLLNSEDAALGCFDNDTIHDTGSNISRLTCKTAGTYLIQGNIHWSANAVGTRYLAIERGRTVVLAAVKQSACSAGNDRQCVSTIYTLAIGQYVELMARQDSGGSLDIIALGNASPVFSMVRLY